jgi:hypothetical protein
MHRLLVAMVALVVSSRPADACKCATPSLATAAARAKIVLVGTIAKVNEDRRCDPRHPTWCTSSFTYEVTVEGVFKGSAGKTIRIDAGHGRGDCSPGSLGKHAVGQRWLVLSTSTQAPLFIHMCGGTQRATTANLDTLAKQLGAPKAPS